MSTTPLATFDLGGWHEEGGEVACTPVSVVGFEPCVVFVMPELGQLDEIEARAEGRKRGGAWSDASQRRTIQSPMKVGLPSSVLMELPLNPRTDSFEELRVVWRRTGGTPRTVTAKIGMRNPRG